jgi:hypothetical protein
MIKRSVLFLLALTTSTIVSSQVYLQPRIGFGLSTISGGMYDPSVGILVGSGFELQVSKLFSIQPELNFIKGGATYRDQFFGDDQKTSLTYLQIPVLAKVKLGSRFFFNLGPYYGLGLGDTPNSEPGIIGGFGFLLGRSRKFIVEGRLSRGLKGIDNTINNTTGSSLSVLLMAAWRLKLGSK